MVLFPFKKNDWENLILNYFEIKYLFSIFIKYDKQQKFLLFWFRTSVLFVLPIQPSDLDEPKQNAIRIPCVRNILLYVPKEWQFSEILCAENLRQRLCLL